MSMRALKFWLLRLAAPVGIAIMRLNRATHRIEAVGVDALVAAQPAVVIYLHGCNLAMFSLHKVGRRHGLTFRVLSSPSRDGVLAESIVRAAGMVPVKGSSKSKGASGALTLVRALHDGHNVIMAVDGPRGPRGIPKPGFAAIAQSGGARVFAVSCSARPALVFKSWDRMFLPLPFARMRLIVREVPIAPGAPPEAAIASARTILHQDSTALDSPARAEG